MLTKALHLAAKEGNVEFVLRVSKAFPQLNFRVSSGLWNTFFFAIKHRQAEVFNLIHGLRVKNMIATQIDTFGNNMLHVAGQLAPPSQLNRIAGPALQMQRELQWFKVRNNIHFMDLELLYLHFLHFLHLFLSPSTFFTLSLLFLFFSFSLSC